VPAVCGAPTGTESKKYACVEPWPSWSREKSGRDLNAYNIGVLSGNRIRPLIQTPTILSLFQRIAYACRKTGCYADSWAVVGSYLETIYTLFCAI